MTTDNFGTLEDRVKEFRNSVNKIQPHPSILIKANILINDLWMSLQIYRAINKEQKEKS